MSRLSRVTAPTPGPAQPHNQGTDMTETTRAAEDPRLWVQITGDLRDKLTSGAIATGDTVSITQLSDQWGASRQTVAKALRTLESDGLLRRYPGLGYYVLPGK
jgi:DNA-binding GntR family transcriptional regulator